MTLSIDLTQNEQARLQMLADIRGVKPEEHAHLLLTNLLESAPSPTPTRGEDQEERERLMSAVKSGDKQAWVELLYMAPPAFRLDSITGESLPPIPDEALRRESLCEDRF